MYSQLLTQIANIFWSQKTTVSDQRLTGEAWYLHSDNIHTTKTLVSRRQSHQLVGPVWGSSSYIKLPVYCILF